MGQFLERHSVSKLAWGEINNLKKPISIKKILPIINTLSKRKHQDQMA